MTSEYHMIKQYIKWLIKIDPVIDNIDQFHIFDYKLTIDSVIDNWSEGSHGHDCMVVRFTTTCTCAISAYHH